MIFNVTETCLEDGIGYCVRGGPMGERWDTRYARSWLNMQAETGALWAVHDWETWKHLRDPSPAYEESRYDGMLQTTTVSRSRCPSQTQRDVDVWQWLMADRGGW